MYIYEDGQELIFIGWVVPEHLPGADLLQGWPGTGTTGIFSSYGQVLPDAMILPGCHFLNSQLVYSCDYSGQLCTDLFY